MKTLTAGLAAHVALETTTMASCWKVTRATDGQVLGFTSHDEDLVVSGVTYTAATGYKATAIQTTAQFAVDNLDIEGVLDSAGLLDVDLAAGLWDFSTVEIFEVNWADLTQGTLKQRKGWLGEVRTGRVGFVAELRGVMQKLQQSLGRLYGSGCDADLGDARCKVVLGGSPSLYTVSGAVTSVTSNRVFADSSRTEANGWFDQGKITWTSGENDDLSMEVKSYLLAGGAISLVLPMGYTVTIGDAYTMTAGCDKTFATCVSKFGNSVNFRGFPSVPGVKRLISGGM